MKNKFHAALLPAAFILYALYRLYWCRNMGSNVYGYFTYVFGTVGFADEKNFIWNIAIWIVPQLLVISCCSDLFEKDLMSNASLVFTRTGTRKIILMKYSAYLGIKSVLIALAEIILCLVIALLSGFSFAVSAPVMLIESMNVLGYMVFVALMINVLSLFINNIYALFITVFIEIAQLFYLKGSMAFSKFMPVSGLMQEVRSGGGYKESIQVLITICVLNIILAVLGSCLFERKKDLL